MSKDCDLALNEIYIYLDGEMTASARARIEQHLRDCSPCLEAFDFEAELRRVVSDKCREHVPDDVRARILTALEAGAFDPAEPPTA